MNTRLIAIILSLTVTALTTCKTPTIKADPYWNDMARYLAGKPLEKTSNFAQLTSYPFYKHHKTDMDRFWSRVINENIMPINTWRTRNIPASTRSQVAFYPFSGADFINLYTFFPNAETYIMIALEEPGPLPNPQLLSHKKLSMGLGSIRRVIRTIASENYFQSGIMHKEMTNRYITGILPVLMIFMARLNLTITDVEMIGIDGNGDVFVLKHGNQKTNNKDVYGCRITFTDPVSMKSKNVIYMKMRLGDTCVNGKSPVSLFFSKIEPANTLIKSAVYLLHNKNFKNFCIYTQGKSRIIIQDDSGIPFRYFNSRMWNISLYGDYQYPQRLRDLQNPPHQKELTLAYKMTSTPLPFNFGYGVKKGPGKSNLMLIIKK